MGGHGESGNDNMKRVVSGMMSKVWVSSVCKMLVHAGFYASSGSLK